MMNRNLYLAGIICFTMAFVIGGFWIFNFLNVGNEFNEFVAFPNLVIIDGVNVVFCDIILLLYFHSKKYKLAFSTNLISAITFMILYPTVIAFFKNGGYGEFINHFTTAHLLAMTIFSLSLVFSKASERPLLKIAGRLGVVVGIIVLSTHLVGLDMTEGATLNTLLNIQQWIGRLGGLILILYILNFYQELKSDRSPVLA